jgi:hypothetical protein
VHTTYKPLYANPKYYFIVENGNSMMHKAAIAAEEQQVDDKCKIS